MIGMAACSAVALAATTAADAARNSLRLTRRWFITILDSAKFTRSYADWEFTGKDKMDKLGELQKVEDRLILDEQMAYYRARAHEYDEWFLRQGRYDRGPEHRNQWLGEAAEIEAQLRSAVRGAEVLEWPNPLARD
jgi:hypothetical protein